jgi:hypothetical protein
MSVYLLLSTDAQLQIELEILLETGSSGRTLVRASGWEEVAVYQESLQDIDAILIDRDSFEIPEYSPLPFILLGRHRQDENRNLPTLPKPLPADTASQLPQLLPEIKGCGNSSPAARSDTAFMLSMLRELVHDLNNQFTTLRGNLPLIESPHPEDQAAIADMIHATENANRLVHMIEAWFPDNRPEYRIFPLSELLRDFSHFANKLYSPGIDCALSASETKILISGDPALLCGYWLQCLPLLGSEHAPLRIELGHESPRDLELHFSSSSPSSDLTALKTNLQSWPQACPPSLMQCRVEGALLICRLPKRLRL